MARVLRGDAFRTDAKCETGRAALGGHSLFDGSSFSLEVDSGVAPFMFKEDGESQWASTTEGCSNFCIEVFRLSGLW